jgi:hypothetical protein
VRVTLELLGVALGERGVNCRFDQIGTRLGFDCGFSELGSDGELVVAPHAVRLGGSAEPLQQPV